MNRVLPRENVTFDGPNLVVCEGFSDVRFLKQLLDRRNIEPFEIGCPSQAREGQTADGREGIVEYLQAIKVYSTKAVNGLRSIAVMLDADTNPTGALADAKQWFTEAAFPVPEAAFQWTANVLPRTAILLIPGVTEGGVPRTGTLEHLLVDLIREIDKSTFDCVESFAMCLGGHPDWSDNMKAKMRLQA